MSQLLTSILIAQCEDFTIDDLPYTHVFDNTGQGNDWSLNNFPDSADVAYKLVLNE